MKNEEQKIIENLNNFNNQYVCLGNIINTSSPISAKSIINLISIIDNKQNNINEVFVTKIFKDYKNTFSLRISSIANVMTEVVFSNYEKWENSDVKLLFNLLSERGLNFNDEIIKLEVINTDIDFFSKFKNVEELIIELKEKNQYEKDSEIYSVITEYGGFKADIEKQIYLIEKAYRQTSQEDFNKKVQEYGTLHKAVAFSQLPLIRFLLKDCLVPVDLEDNVGQNAIFLAKNIESLNAIGEFNPNWLKKNKENKDILSVFSRHNKDIGKQLIEYAQKKISNVLTKNDKNPTESIESRLKETLLEMVKQDKTKKEIVDFIKKYNIKNFSDVKDEKGNNLLHIVIANGSWSKAEIFLEHYEIDDVNEDGISCVGLMFNKNYVNYENQAKILMDKLISKESFDKNPKFSQKYLESRLADGRNIALPDWYFYNRLDDSKIDNLYKYILKNEENSDVILKDFKKLKYNKQTWNYNTLDEEENKSIHFYLGHALSKNKEFKLKDLNLKLLLDKVKLSRYTKNGEDFLINKISGESFKRAIEIMNMAFKFEYFEKIEPKVFSEKLENFCASTILFNFNKMQREISKGSFIEEEKMIVSSFYDENIDVLTYFVNKESKVFEELLSEESIWDSFYSYTKDSYKRDLDKEKTLKYLDMVKMNKQLGMHKSLADVEHKSKKIKI